MPKTYFKKITPPPFLFNKLRILWTESQEYNKIDIEKTKLLATSNAHTEAWIIEIGQISHTIGFQTAIT